MIIAAAACILASCNPSQQPGNLNRGPVVVAGRIQNIGIKVISLTVDDVVRGQTRYTQIVDTLDGIFRFNNVIYHAQDLWLRYSNTLITLYAEPSDSLHLSFDAHSTVANPLAIRFSGSNEAINWDIRAYEAYRKVPPFNPACEGKSVKQYHL